MPEIQSGIHEAVVFFRGDKIDKEVLYPEFEAVLDGYIGLPSYAEQVMQAVYLVISPRLHIQAAVFFSVPFDEEGQIEGSWNIPLQHLADHGLPGPDLGGGPIRLACRSSSPVAWHTEQLWDPDLSSGSTFKLLAQAVARNKLGLVVQRSSPQKAEKPTAGAVPSDKSSVSSQQVQAAVAAARAAEMAAKETARKAAEQAAEAMKKVEAVEKAAAKAIKKALEDAAKREAAAEKAMIEAAQKAAADAAKALEKAASTEKAATEAASKAAKEAREKAAAAENAATAAAEKAAREAAETAAAAEQVAAAERAATAAAEKAAAEALAKASEVEKAARESAEKAARESAAALEKATAAEKEAREAAEAAVKEAAAAVEKAAAVERAAKETAEKAAADSAQAIQQLEQERAHYDSKYRQRLADLKERFRLEKIALEAGFKETLEEAESKYVERLEKRDEAVRELKERLTRSRQLESSLKDALEKYRVQLEEIRGEYESSVKGGDAAYATKLEVLREQFERNLDEKLREQAEELNERVAMRETELHYRNEQLTKLREEVAHLKRHQQELLANDSGELLQRMTDNGVTFVAYHPGTEHLVLLPAEITEYLQNPTAFVAERCGVSVEAYEEWLVHYRLPVCRYKNEHGEVCGDPIDKVIKPKFFRHLIGDRCSEHQGLEDAGAGAGADSDALLSSDDWQLK